MQKVSSDQSSMAVGESIIQISGEEHSKRGTSQHQGLRNSFLMDWKELEGRSGFLAGRPSSLDRVPGLGRELGSLLEERTSLSWGQR